MKPFCVILLPLIVALSGCTKEEAQYEMVSTDSGAVRLNRKTGEMVAINQYNQPVYIDLSALREESEIDPVLETIRTFPEFRLPAAKRDVKVKIEYRWLKGRMDYRLTVTPYSDGLNSVIRGSNTSFTIQLQDAAGFEVDRFAAPFSSLIRVVSAEGIPVQWQAEDSIAISKRDFIRIVGINYSWNYSDNLNAVLNPKEDANQPVETTPASAPR